MTKIQFIYPIMLSALTLGCGDDPSSLGNEVARELKERKESFESAGTVNKFTSFLNNQNNLSHEVKLRLLHSLEFAQRFSGTVNPSLAGSSIESFEMAIACSMTILSNEDEIDFFTDNLLNSVDDGEARIKLLKQINNAKNAMLSSVVNKKNCEDAMGNN